MSIVDLNVCRVCLNRLNGKNSKSIREDANILDRFQQCTNLKIYDNDGLPSNICERCNARLKIAFDFRRQATLSDSHLRSFISKINSQFQEVANTTTTKIETITESQLLYEFGYVDDEEINENKIYNNNQTLPSINQYQNEDNFISEIHNENNQNETQLNDELMHVDNDENDEVDIDHNDGGNNNALIELTCDTVGEDEVDNDDNDNDDNDNDDNDDDDEWQTETQDSFTTGQEQSTSKSSQNYVLTEIVIDPLKTAGTKQMKVQRRSTNSKSKLKHGSHICVKCNKDFSTSSNLQRHLDTHEGLKPYVCNVCEKGFTQNGSLKKHMLIHTGERPHVCDVCGRGFTQHTTLTFHMRRHTGERPYSCDVCNRAFRIKDALRRHIEDTHTDNITKVHICSICNRGLKSKYSLQLHLERHRTDGNDIKSQYKCDVCNKVFKYESSLETHKRRHYNLKLFKCNQCDKQFTNKIKFKSHIKMHTEIKPYTCNECGKSFQLEKLLNDHIQYLHHNNTVISNNSKIFQCEECKKTYKIKENLIQHMKTHCNETSQKLYKCDDCNIAYDLLRRYKLHRISKHNEQYPDLNQCDECSIDFVTVKDLNDHIEAVHDAIDEKCTECNQHFTSKKLYEDHVLEHQIEYHHD